MIRTRRAFTLAEMATAMAVGGIVVTGLGSALMLSTRALPTAETLTGEDRRLARALDLIAEDLAAAVHLTELTTTALTLTHHDRTGNTAPETVRYAWSGTKGDPLTRADNAGKPFEIATDLEDLTITWTTQTIPEIYAPRTVEKSAGDLYAYTTTGGTTPYTLNATTYFSQIISPTLPAEATDWTIDTIELYCDSNDDGDPKGYFHFGIFTADIDRGPDTELWDEGQETKDIIPKAAGWVTSKPAGNAGWIAAGTPAAIVYRPMRAPDGDQNVDPVRIRLGGASVTTFFSLNGGDSWTKLASVTPVHRIRGRYRYQIAGMTVERDFVTSVTVSATDTQGRRARTTAPMRNYPEVLDAVWELDFTDDPTLGDLNADGAPDWSVEGDPDFGDSKFKEGWWRIDDTLVAEPTPALDAAVTTIEARLKTDSINGRAAGIELAADADATRAGRLWAELWASGSAGTVILRSRDSGGADVELHREDITDPVVDLRLVLIPKLDTVHLHINGAHAGTYGYERVLTGDADKGLRLQEVFPDTDIEIDHLRIRSGGRVIR